METEEGEILSEEDCYTPLERPPTCSSTLTQTRLPVVYPEAESEEEFDSSSDSDSDLDTKKSKHRKLKFMPTKVNCKNNPRKKYDIWSTHLQEDVLLENLVNCDVSQVDRSRTVETYPLATHMLPRKNNKRTHNDRNKSHLRLNKRINNDENATVNSSPRMILDVHVTTQDSGDDIAKDMANKLYEEKEDLIRTIVTVAGKEKALELFKETKRIEAGGGMLIMNQTRRRTPGGVFFFLVKHDNNLTREQQNEIFQEERFKYKQDVRTKRKLKLQQIKQKIAASKRECEQKLPELLTHAELCVQELAKTKTRNEEGETEDLDVKNPPPSPVTDGHDNSTDGMENINKELSSEHNMNRNLINYEDCTDIGIDMELF